jgi:hypothetical protein
LCAVKGTEERDEPHAALTWHGGRSPVATSKDIHRVYLTWKHPRRLIKVIFQVIKFTFPQNGPLRAVKETKERDKSNVDPN